MKLKPLFVAILTACWLLVGYQPLALAQDPAYNDEEPEIVIRKGIEGEVYYDYRVNGEVVEIKVVPTIGKPYYLVPKDGGYIKQDRSQLLIPSWVLFRW